MQDPTEVNLYASIIAIPIGEDHDIPSQYFHCPYVSHQQNYLREFLRGFCNNKGPPPSVLPNGAKIDRPSYITPPTTHRSGYSSRCAAHPLSFFRRRNTCLCQHVVGAGIWTPFRDTLIQNTDNYACPISTKKVMIVALTTTRYLFSNNLTNPLQYNLNTRKKLWKTHTKTKLVFGISKNRGTLYIKSNYFL